MQYEQHYSKRATPQSVKIPGSSQVPNSAGGFSFAVDDWKRLERFLLLGSEGGSYYASERKLTLENCTSLEKCLAEDPVRMVELIVDVSDKGRAPKNDQAIFALAVVAASPSTEVRSLAYSALPKVCRIGTHLFQFISAMEANRGWSRGMRSAVSRWYTARSVDKLAEQLAKYQQRNGWSHRDVLRLAHPKGDLEQSKLFQWAVGKTPEGDDRETFLASLRPAIIGLEKAMSMKAAKAKEAAKVITEYKLPRECVPTQWLTHAEVWGALLADMPMTAMVRNLGNMSKVGLLQNLSEASRKVCAQLRNTDRIKQSRLHPLAILTAMRTYGSGHGMRGSGAWNPDQSVMDALDDAFYLSFGNVTPTGKRIHLALDVSGSMGGSTIANSPLTCRDAAAAMALVTAKVESDYFVTAFQDKLVPLAVSPKMRLDDVIRKTSNLPFGTTDCAQPMLYSLSNKIQNDAFIVITDSETWSGKIHPTQALTQYRQQMGIPAKMIVVGMVANQFSIADQEDAGQMDVVGFDLATPQVMSSFIAEGV